MTTTTAAGGLPADRLRGFAIGIVGLGLVLGGIRLVTQFDYGYDFSVYRAAGAAVIHHHALYGPWIGTRVPRALPFTYPPLAAVVAVPFANVPDLVGFVAWNTVSIVALFAVVRACTTDLVARFDRPALALATLFAVALALAPVQEEIRYGRSASCSWPCVSSTASPARRDGRGARSSARQRRSSSCRGSSSRISGSPAGAAPPDRGGDVRGGLARGRHRHAGRLAHVLDHARVRQQPSWRPRLRREPITQRRVRARVRRARTGGVARGGRGRRRVRLTTRRRREPRRERDARRRAGRARRLARVTGVVDPPSRMGGPVVAVVVGDGTNRRRVAIAATSAALFTLRVPYLARSIPTGWHVGWIAAVMSDADTLVCVALLLVLARLVEPTLRSGGTRSSARTPRPGTRRSLRASRTPAPHR